MAVNPKHDRQGVRRASEIEQKYNLSLLENFGKDDSRYKEEMSKFEQEFTQYKVTTDGKIELLDGNVQGVISDLKEIENATEKITTDIEINRSNIQKNADAIEEIRKSSGNLKITYDASTEAITLTMV